MSQATPPEVIIAAGAVCWRLVKGKVRVLLVHRVTHADVSLPKGKLDPGETIPQTAVREVEEETGLRVALGVPLLTIEYPLGAGRDKVVHYWAAEVTEEVFAQSTFRPNQEIAALEWLPIDKARKALSYEHDREVLDGFAALVDAHRIRTFAIIAVRHAKTIAPANWDGPDATRPLLHRGLDQAESIAPAIAAFHPVKLISSTAARCRATLEPLSSLIGVPISATADISQDAHARGDARVAKVVRRRLAKRKTAVLCSHGPVLPEIIAEVARQTGTDMDAALRGAAELSTGDFNVLHVSLDHPEGGLVAVETHSPSERSARRR